MNDTTATLTRPPPAPHNGSRAPVDLFPQDKPMTPGELRYREILGRLKAIEKDLHYYAQRVEDWSVDVLDAKARVRTFDARLSALEAAGEATCPSSRELEDLRIILDDHGHNLDELATDLDRVALAVGINLHPGDPLPAAQAPEIPA